MLQCVTVSCPPDVVYHPSAVQCVSVCCPVFDPSAVCSVWGQCKSISGQIGLIWRHCCPLPFNQTQNWKQEIQHLQFSHFVQFLLTNTKPQLSTQCSAHCSLMFGFERFSKPNMSSDLPQCPQMFPNVPQCSLNNVQRMSLKCLRQRECPVNVQWCSPNVPECSSMFGAWALKCLHQSFKVLVKRMFPNIRYMSLKCLCQIAGRENVQ